MPSLGLLFELADSFEGSVGFDGDPLVSTLNAERAIAWCEYLESHANRICSCVGYPSGKRPGFLPSASRIENSVLQVHLRAEKSIWRVGLNLKTDGLLKTP